MQLLPLHNLQPLGTALHSHLTSPSIMSLGRLALHSSFLFVIRILDFLRLHRGGSRYRSGWEVRGARVLLLVVVLLILPHDPPPAASQGLDPRRSLQRGLLKRQPRGSRRLPAVQQRGGVLQVVLLVHRLLAGHRGQPRLSHLRMGPVCAGATATRLLDAGAPTTAHDRGHDPRRGTTLTQVLTKGPEAAPAGPPRDRGGEGRGGAGGWGRRWNWGELVRGGRGGWRGERRGSPGGGRGHRGGQRHRGGKSGHGSRGLGREGRGGRSGFSHQFRPVFDGSAAPRWRGGFCGVFLVLLVLLVLVVLLAG
eukprot:RCo052191